MVAYCGQNAAWCRKIDIFRSLFWLVGSRDGDQLTALATEGGICTFQARCTAAYINVAPALNGWDEG
eukprot:6186828-Pleurochrysis_carterae.AAC.3